MKLMKTSRAKVNAKINLTLNIAGTDSENYHIIDSVVAPIDISDAISVTSRKDKLINLKVRGMDMLAPENNNAYKAAYKFMNEYGTGGADITVSKNIPVGGGLGGSSADIAGVLKCMAEVYGVKDDLSPLANALSSDGAYMLRGGFARISGRGEKVEPLTFKETLNLVIVTLKEGVDSGRCYAKFDETNGRLGGAETETCAEAVRASDIKGICASCFNALEAPAMQLLPELRQVREDMLSLSPLCVSMSGSGSSMFAVYETKELCDWARLKLRKKYDICFTAKTLKDKMLTRGNIYRLDGK